MYCIHCGEEIPNSSRFCKYCGKRVEDSENVKEQAAVSYTAEYVPKASGTEIVPSQEAYAKADGFFFKGVHPFKKFLLAIGGIVIMLLTASVVFMCTYPDLIDEVFNTIR